MKNKYIIVLFVLASIVVLFGALLKVMHYEFGAVTGNVLLTIGMLSQILMALVFVIKLLFTSKEKDSFFNR
ncbi:MAG: hypothetical protein PSV16_06745 [Flavobacterium sp.]|nr:hypothetical protein [Flavobacterium sp.]